MKILIDFHIEFLFRFGLIGFGLFPNQDCSFVRFEIIKCFENVCWTNSIHAIRYKDIFSQL